MIKNIFDSQILVVGLVRNCESQIEKEFNIINAAFSDAKTLNWLVIESDSEDATVAVLERLKSKKTLTSFPLENFLQPAPREQSE